MVSKKKACAGRSHHTQMKWLSLGVFPLQQSIAIISREAKGAIQLKGPTAFQAHLQAQWGTYVFGRIGPLLGREEATLPFITPFPFTSKAPKESLVQTQPLQGIELHCVLGGSLTLSWASIALWIESSITGSCCTPLPCRSTHQYGVEGWFFVFPVVCVLQAW